MRKRPWTIIITKLLFQSPIIVSSAKKCSNPKDWKGAYDDRSWFYLFTVFMKCLSFCFFATLGDIVTTIKCNYDSPERDQAVKRDLWMAAKSIIAFVIACCLLDLEEQ